MRTSLFLSLSLLASSGWAHGMPFRGGPDSNAGIVVSALLAVANSDPSVQLAPAGHGTEIFREDKMGAVRCVRTQDFSECKAIQKHNRPLENFNEYPEDDYIGFEEGGLESNAYLIIQELGRRGLGLKAEDVSTLLTCETGATYSCQLNLK